MAVRVLWRICLEEIVRSGIELVHRPQSESSGVQQLKSLQLTSSMSARWSTFCSLLNPGGGAMVDDPSAWQSMPYFNNRPNRLNTASYLGPRHAQEPLSPPLCAPRRHIVVEARVLQCLVGVQAQRTHGLQFECATLPALKCLRRRGSSRVGGRRRREVRRDFESRACAVLQQLRERSMPRMGSLKRDREEKQRTNVLPRKPAPKLERFLADAPPAREICELAHVAIVMRKRKRVLVVVQVELAHLCSTVGPRFFSARERSTYLQVDAVSKHLRLRPPLRAWRQNCRRTKHDNQAGVRVLVVPGLIISYTSAAYSASRT